MQKVQKPLEPRHAHEVLAACDVFSGMEETRLHAWAGAMEWLVFTRGETLIRAGEPGDDLFVVASGRLAVSVYAEDGAESVVREVGRGSTVGEVALIVGAPRTATVRAVRDTLVGRLSRSAFERLMADDAHSALQFTRVIAGWLLPGALPQHTSAPAVVALVPMAGADLGQAARRLAGSVDDLTLLDPGRVDAILGGDAARSPAGSAWEPALAELFDAAEREHSMVALVADPEPGSEWSARTLRQADRVLVIASDRDRPDDAENRARLDRIATTVPDVPRELVLLHSRATPPHGLTGTWLEAGGFARHNHVVRDADADWARLGRQLTGRSIGLVLGGGGAKGLAHIGVLRAIAEADIDVDHVGGTSMGALVGGLWATGLTADEITQRNRDTWLRRSPLRGFTLPLVALLGSGRISSGMEMLFGDRRIEDQPRAFFCTSTNLTHNRSVIHSTGPLQRYVLASMAIPGVVPPVVDDGQLLVDGGVLDNLPVEAMSRTGAGAVIAVDVSPPRTFSVAPHFQQAPGVLDLMRARVGKTADSFPNIVRILERTATLGAEREGAAVRQRSDVLFIAPPVSDFDTFDMKRLDVIIERGYRSTVTAIESWKTNGQL